MASYVKSGVWRELIKRRRVRFDCERVWEFLLATQLHLELCAVEDRGALSIAAQLAPGLLRSLSKFEHQCEQAAAGKVALDPIGAISHGGKHRLDHVGRADVLPVRCGEVKERQL